MEKIDKNEIKGKSDVLLTVAVIAAIIGIVVFSGCIGEPQEKQNLTQTEKKTKTFTDDLNRTVEIQKNPERIVAIATADVEILFLINASEKLVGRPNFQRYPPEALKIDEIGGMFPMNLEKIIAKNPDLILITRTFKEEYIKQVSQLESYNLTVVGFNYPNTMKDTINHIKIIGEVVGKENEAKDLTKNITFRISKITKITNKLNESQKPKVYREWIYAGSKGSTAGRTSRGNNIILMAGGKNIFGDVEKSSFEANTEEIVNKNPDIIIIIANLDKFNPDELKEVIKSRPGWKNIDAIKNDRICVIESQITWANPRLIQGLEEFAKCIHPELFGIKTITPTNYSVNYPITITDCLGRNVTIYREPKRIVSGHPASTENLFALGAGDRIILKTDLSKYPPEALKIPSVISPPSVEFIVNSSPDVVFIYVNIKVAQTLEDINITTVAVGSAKDIEDIIEKNIKLIGRVINKVEEAEKLSEGLKNKVEKIRNKKEEMTNPPKILIFAGTQRLAVGSDTYIHDAATIAGGVNIFSDTPKKVDINIEAIVGRNPNIILLPNDFYGKGSGSSFVNEIKKNKLWSSVDAVKNNRFCILDRDIIFARTPRIVDAIEQEFNCFNNWETKKFCNSDADCTSDEFCNTTNFACKSK